MTSSKLANISLCSGIVAWGCLIIGFVFLYISLSTFIAYAQWKFEGGTIYTASNIPLTLLWLLTVVFVGSSIVLPGIGIITGIRAIRIIGSTGTGGKWRAWGGIILGSLIYLTLSLFVVYLISVQPG